MTTIAPLLEAFFLDRLLEQQRASANTIASYRDTFRLLLIFAEQRLLKAPSSLLLSDIDAPFVGSFLHYLESQRNNSILTRNTRLAAIHSFFRFVAISDSSTGAKNYPVHLSSPRPVRESGRPNRFWYGVYSTVTLFARLRG